MVNILSVDLESWVHADPTIYHHLTPEERKEKDQQYIIKSTEYLLNLFHNFKTKATFFVVSEIFDWYPELIQQIKVRGHEVAFHTRSHRIISDVKDIEKEIIQSKQFIGTFKPKGFRAPFMRIKKEFFNILGKNGFTYDSSIYHHRPIKNFINGVDEIPVSIFSFRELGLSTIRLPKHLSFPLLLSGFPYGSGYFMKLDKLVDFFIRKGSYNHLFIHPWQVSKPESYFMSKKYLIKNPHWFLYSFNVTKSLINILRKYRFYSIEYYRTNPIIFK